MKTRINKKRIFFFVFVLCVLIATPLLLIKNYDNKLVTQTAYLHDAFSTIETKALLVRDEISIESPKGENLVMVAKEAEKLAKGEVIAFSFQDRNSSQAYLEKQALNRKLERYEKLNSSSKVGAVDVRAAERGADELYLEFLDRLYFHDFVDMPMLVEKIRDEIILYQNSISNEKADYSQQIEEIKRELKAFDSYGQPAQSFKTEASGYFLSFSDGLERELSIKDPVSLSAEEFEVICESLDLEKKEGKAKLVKDFKFHILALIDDGDAHNLYDENQNGTKSYELAFGKNQELRIKAELLALNKGKNNKNLAVFLCKDINEELMTWRYEDMSIIFNKTHGLKIDKRALRFNDEGKPGVYVRSINLVKFVKVDILEEYEDYFGVEYTRHKYEEIVKANGKIDVIEVASLQVYDEVIVEGKDLYGRKYK